MFYISKRPVEPFTFLCSNKRKHSGGFPMIRDICKDEFFLSQKSEPATANDLAIAQDLLDTLAAHKDGCVGMAANMITVFECDVVHRTALHALPAADAGA